jgi:flavodoxin
VFGFTEGLKVALSGKGFDLVGSFTCRGLDTFGPLRLIGGINKGHPNDADLTRARAFAAGLRDRLAPVGSAGRVDARAAHGRTS